jgi:8-oxo-dGTP pyrophosphatase MutT (NUDIX family)
MAPLPRVGWRPSERPPDSRRDAALLLLYPVGGRAHLPLTLRAANLTHHGGQVSLPGGSVHDTETVQATALREAGEEVGIDPAAVTIVGGLSPLHIPVSGFVLYPIVGVTDRQPSFVPCAHEVARVLDVALDALADPRAVRVRIRRHEGRDFEVPYFLADGEVVWGATAMVLAEFLALLGHAPFRPTAATAYGIEPADG